MNYFRCGGGRSTHTATKIDVAKTPLASFQSNVSGLYLPEILAYIQATQSGSGDPSPSNPRAITGWSGANVTRCGVNVWGGSAFLQSFIDANISGFAYDDSTMTYTASTIRNKVIQGGKFKENTRYTFFISGINALANSNTNLRVYYTDGSYNMIQWDNALANTKQVKAYVTSANKTVSFLRGANAAGTVTLYYNECGVIEGNLTTSDFVPYLGNTYTIAFGDTYYGGYVNVTTGLLTVTHKSATLDETTANDWSHITQETLERWQYTGISDIKNIGGSARGDILCDRLKSMGEENGILHYQNRVWVYVDSSVSDSTAWTNWLTANPLNIVYELATPQTYQLTPAQIEQLLGQNNVFCSSGDVAVKFWKVD